MAADPQAALILVVDDDRGLLRLLHKTLQREGYEVVTASSGAEAAAWLAVHRPDLMLLDLKLQDLEGRELISRLETVRQAVPFVIITGQGDERVAVEMMRRGALDYLVKDVRFIEFVPTVVKRALERLEKEKRLALAEERAHLGLTVVEQSHSAVLITGTDPKDPEIVYTNPAFTELTGLSAGEIAGARLSAIEARTGKWAVFRRVIRTTRPFTGEVAVRRIDGERRTTDCHIAPVAGPDGQVKHWIVVQRDTTWSRRLEREILEAGDQERRRIGRDLHDGLGQHLTGLEFMSHTLAGKVKAAVPQLGKQAEEICRQIRETIKQTRLLSHNLSPVPLEADGLMAALSELAEGTRAMSGIECDFRCPVPVSLSDPQTATHLYRIAQEAVTNAMKHSAARRICLTLTRETGRVRMSIEDNGDGLPQAERKDTGIGLRMMGYRAQLIGATLEITSTPRKGTRITCVLRAGK